MRFTKHLWVTTVLASIILLLSTSLLAESKARRVWKWSIAALVTGASMDVSSSIGQYEANPIVRQPNGLFSPRRGIAIKAGVCTGLILLGRKHSKVGTTANFTAGGIWAGVAIRNWRVRK